MPKVAVYAEDLELLGVVQVSEGLTKLRALREMLRGL